MVKLCKAGDSTFSYSFEYSTIFQNGSLNLSLFFCWSYRALTNI